MIEKKSLKYQVKKKCYDCSIVEWGNLGKCKKHSPIHTLHHMSFHRWVFWHCVKIGKMIVASVLPFIIKVVVVVAFAVLILYALNFGLQKQELVACNKLKSYSQTYSLFYLTETEKAMCDAHGVYIDAPVK